MSYLPEIIIFGVTIVNFTIGVFVLYKNPTNLVNISFFVFVLGATLWIVSFSLILITHDFFFNQLIFHGGTIMFAGFLVFSKVFPSNIIPPKKFWVSLIPLLIIMFLTPLNLFVKGMLFLPDHGVQPVNGPLMPFYAGVVLAYVLYSFYLLLNNFKHSTGTVHMQLRYLFWGMGIFMGSTILFDAILPSFKIFTFNFLGPISSVIFIGITAYAILRHNFLDVRIRFLEKIVEERTRELEALYNAQSKFLADISHELQTPLSIIKGNVSLLRRKAKDGEEVNHSLTLIEEKTDHLSRLVRDLLSLAKTDFQAQKLDKKPVAVHKLLKEIYEDCRSSRRTKILNSY